MGGPAAERAVGILAGTATIAAPLDALPEGVEFEPPLSDRLHFDPAARQLQFLGALTTDERDTLLALSADAAYTAAVNSLFDQPRAFFREQLTFQRPPRRAAGGPRHPAAARRADDVRCRHRDARA